MSLVVDYTVRPGKPSSKPKPPAKPKIAPKKPKK